MNDKKVIKNHFFIVKINKNICNMLSQNIKKA